MRPIGDIKKSPWKMVKGLDIWLALTSSVISASIMWGWSSAKGKFHGRNVLCKGRGFPIGDPKMILLMRSGNWFKILQRSRVYFKLSTSNGVMCMYNTSERSVLWRQHAGCCCRGNKNVSCGARTLITGSAHIHWPWGRLAFWPLRWDHYLSSWW